MAPAPTVFVLPGIYGRDWRLDDFLRGLSRYCVPILLDHKDGDGCRGLSENGRRVADLIANSPSHGHINLLGYSYGANVAFEAASALVALGRKVAFVGIIDPALADTEFGPFTDEPARVRDFVVKESRLLMFILRCNVPWTISLHIPHKRLRSKIYRKMCLVSRLWARRRWHPSPIEVGGLLVTSRQFGVVTNPKLMSLCPEMKHIEVESRHIDVLVGVSGTRILQSIHDLLYPRDASGGGGGPG